MLYPVIYGSVRAERQGIRAARYITSEIARRGHEVVLVDPLTDQLPLLERQYKEYEPGKAPKTMQRLSELFSRADGFVIVSGEYNHGIPPALKNLLDHYLEEYFFRPSAIVSYSGGRYGGVRAAMQLRMVLGELGMPSISSILAIPNVSSTFAEDGTPQADYLPKAATRFLDEFDWWANAARVQRASAGTPY